MSIAHLIDNTVKWDSTPWVLASFIPILLFLAIFVVTIIFVPYWRTRRIHSLYPTASRMIFSPIIGYKIQQESSKQKYGNPLAYLIKQRQQGQNFIVTNTLTKPNIVLLDTRLARELFFEHYKFHRHSNFLFKQLFYTHSLWNARHMEWQRHRGIIQPYFNEQAFQKLIPIISSIVSRVLDTNIDESKPVRVYQLFLKIAAESISEQLFSTNVNALYLNGTGLIEKIGNTYF